MARDGRRKRAAGPLLHASALRGLRVAGLALVATAPGPVHASPENDLIWRVLRRSILAHRTVNLRGWQVDITQGPDGANRTTFRKVVRRRDGSSVSLAPPDGGRPRVMVMEDAALTRTYAPETNTIVISRTLPAARSESEVLRIVRRILSAYRVKYNGTAPFAGRTCHRLSLDPFDWHGRVVNLWIDTSNGATLARLESDRRGNMLAYTAFNQIEYPARISDAEVRPPFPSSAKRESVILSPLYRDLGALRKAAEFPLAAPCSMPPGFAFDSGEIVRLDGNPTACLRYSDGIAMISIFQSRAREIPYSAYQPLYYKASLPRGESIVMTAHTGLTCTVIGPRDDQGIIKIARALNVERERELSAELMHEYRISPAALRRLRDRGIGMDVMAALLEISERTRRTLESLVTLHSQGFSWRQVATRVGVPLDSIASRIRRFECR